MTRSTDPTRRLAKITGLSYLGIIATGISAEFLVRGALVVDDDPLETTRNIAGSPALFGIGIGADLVMIALDVTVAIGLYRLLRRHDRRLSLTAAGLRVAQAAVLALNLVNLVRALDLAQAAVGADGSIPAGSAADVLRSVERHALGYDAGLIAFGLSCLVLARLLATSGLVSRRLAVGMGVTGGVYVIGSLTALFAPAVNEAILPLYAVALVVELAFAIRLVAGPAPIVPRVVAPVAAA